MEREVTYSFGKKAWCGKRKINLITLEVCLRDWNGYPEFTASGNIWNNIHTDIIAGGQCLDDIIERFPGYKSNLLFSTIYDLWIKYHLKNVSNIPAIDRAKIDLLVSGKSRDDVLNELKQLKN